SGGRIWKYGEFLPYDLSPFMYNEAMVIQYYPFSKEEVLKNGWKWREPSTRNYTITLPADEIPDSIHDVQDSILKEILGCGLCGKAFKITSAELALLRRFEIPVSHFCSDCRHMERLSHINQPKLWDRNCIKCNKEIQTSYAPDRPEIVYCEQCYQQEVV
ncbi:MAG: hypothetical protein NT094_04165, partial [Candidatus Staskawiczbacteria bacterium]|nr:hypothetical protein [Candidatus Staskawiczbacteria bacterium]